jgi:hypothetical protein
MTVRSDALSGTPADLPSAEATADQSPPRTPTIADKYADLLRPLNNQQRQAITLRLAFGFYEGWQPSRGEMADVVAVELGTLSAEEALRRQRRRNQGKVDGSGLPA